MQQNLHIKNSKGGGDASDRCKYKKVNAQKTKYIKNSKGGRDPSSM